MNNEKVWQLFINLWTIPFFLSSVEFLGVIWLNTIFTKIVLECLRQKREKKQFVISGKQIGQKLKWIWMIGQRTLHTCECFKTREQSASGRTTTTRKFWWAQNPLCNQLEIGFPQRRKTKSWPDLVNHGLRMIRGWFVNAIWEKYQSCVFLKSNGINSIGKFFGEEQLLWTAFLFRF